MNCPHCGTECVLLIVGFDTYGIIREYSCLECLWQESDPPLEIEECMSIDYGNGETNIDKETGIRFGVIHQHEVLQAWADESEPDYQELGEDDEDLDIEVDSFSLDKDGYKAVQNSVDDGDIFIIKSPFYTLCDFCSPCAPGAGYLLTPGDVKAYCFGHDWFYDHPEHPGIAPYRVFRVEDDVEVFAEPK